MALTDKQKTNVLNVLQMVALIGPLFTQLLALIREAEDPAVDGTTKKAGVLAFVEALLKAGATKVAGLDDATIALAKEAASWVIDAYVAFKNTLGHFAHKVSG